MRSMVSAFISRFLVLTLGTLYPAYKSYKGVKSRNVREYVKWMMYWIIFALYLCVEALTDIFVSFWLPLYYEIKILFIIWLLSPYTKGASLLYRKFVHPFLLKHENEIDQYLEQAKRESYARVVRLGNRGINYAKEAVAIATLRGHEHLVNQIRKTVSLNDVSENDPERNVLQQNALQYDPNAVDETDLPHDVMVSSLRVKRVKQVKKRPALSAVRRANVPSAAMNSATITEPSTNGQELDDTDDFASSSLVEKEFGYLNEEEEIVDDDAEMDQSYADAEYDNDDSLLDDPDYEDSHTAVSNNNNYNADGSTKLNKNVLDHRSTNSRKMKADGTGYATLPRRSQRKLVKKE